jgi:hypothetical protein
MLSALASPLAIALLALTQSAQPIVEETDDGFRITTHVARTLYQSDLTRDAIRKTPAWDQETENPPVSLKKAIRLAEKMRKSVVNPPDNRKWEVANMHLIFEGKHCAWYVTFHTKPIEQEAGLIDDFDEITLFVLMDGTVIKPTVMGLDKRK